MENVRKEMLSKKIRATWLGTQTLAAEKRKGGLPGWWRAQIASVSQIHRSLGGDGLFTHRKKLGPPGRRGPLRENHHSPHLVGRNFAQHRRDQRQWWIKIRGAFAFPIKLKRIHTRRSQIRRIFGITAGQQVMGCRRKPIRIGLELQGVTHYH